MNPSMIPENPDSINNEVEIISLPPKLRMWRITPEFGNIIPIEPDTSYHYFQNSNLVEGYTGNYNYLGNLGAPRQNRIFFERRDYSSALFLDPYYFFIDRPEDFNFTDSNIPYTNLSYYKAGGKIDGEERFKAYFSVNVNKNLAFGFLFDYLYGRGFYNHQSTSFFKTGLFGSYVTDKYKAHLLFQNYNMKMAENGGVTNDRYITDPEGIATDAGSRVVSGRDIPTVLDNTFNYNKNFYVYLNHRYNLGFHRDIADPANDTDTISEFVPVTSFIHTFKIERTSHQFISNNEPEGYYKNTYINKNLQQPFSNDSTTYLGVKNILGVALLEGFNRYAKAGLTAFVSHKYSRYRMMDTISTSGRYFTEHEVFVGGELSKRQGSILHYNAIGEVGLLGKAIGQFRVKGGVDLNFRLWNDTVSLYARGAISNTLPAFYMRHYQSNHFWWDNDDMDKEFRTRIEGELDIARWRTNLKVGVENIKNYTYFGMEATPKQFSENIQVVSAKLNQNFKLGILHLDNEVSWQKSSNNDILPLPDLSLYHNLYLETKLAKRVLTVQLGADLRYFTKYYAPAYSPGIQQFHLQPDVDSSGRVKTEIGGYPFINVYANFHLKRTRFFVMMYHVNQGMGDSNSFMTPHYPVNQRLLKLGLSWNFFD